MTTRTKNHLIYVLSVTTLLSASACTQQQAAQVETKGDVYYGRYERFRDGVEVPRYSDENRAVQDPAIATKYLSPKHEYSLSAAVPDVDVRDIEKASLAAKKAGSSRSVKQISSLPDKGVSVPVGGATASPVVAEIEDDALANLAELPDTDSIQMEKPKAPSLESLNHRNSNFIWPVDGKIISRFGPKKNGLVNDGINIASAEGSPVWSAANGEVIYAGNELKGYGNMVIVRHRNGWMTAYAHMSDFVVQKGTNVTQGDLIGYVGRTGNVRDAQLHFGIRQGKKPINPETLLPRKMASAN
ncbi:MAG: M23 family metallopeptidase [Rickettsiales bacterium]|nr:M23 family metallopeptidase [Rickettsiales bacterium]